MRTASRSVSVVSSMPPEDRSTVEERTVLAEPDIKEEEEDEMMEEGDSNNTIVRKPDDAVDGSLSDGD